jgi:ppGpp synthetase/RelA/SpoT-type nucleotidyltranferase
MIADAELDDLRVRFLDEKPRLEALRERVLEILEAELSARGLAAAVAEARVKDVSNFVKKVLRKDYSEPWDEVRDKLGARLLTPYTALVPELERLVHESFVVHHHENKRDELPPEKLDYLGIHFEVSLPRGTGQPTDLTDEVFEIQIHTTAETLWAAVSHELIYKAAEDPPEDIKRSLYRLLALVELFDLEVSRCREEIMALPRFNQARILWEIERHFFTLTARHSDAALSRLVIGFLEPLLSDQERAGDFGELAAFVDQHREKLESIYADYVTDDRNPIISQPESLLIFEQLEHDRYRLTDLWNETLPPGILRSLSEIWGTPVDVHE